MKKILLFVFSVVLCYSSTGFAQQRERLGDFSFSAEMTSQTSTVSTPAIPLERDHVVTIQDKNNEHLYWQCSWYFSSAVVITTDKNSDLNEAVQPVRTMCNLIYISNDGVKTLVTTVSTTLVCRDHRVPFLDKKGLRFVRLLADFKQSYLNLWVSSSELVVFRVMCTYDTSPLTSLTL